MVFGPQDKKATVLIGLGNSPNHNHKLIYMGGSASAALAISDGTKRKSVSVSTHQ